MRLNRASREGGPCEDGVGGATEDGADEPEAESNVWRDALGEEVIERPGEREFFSADRDGGGGRGGAGRFGTE